jgi:hypothetical protein
VSDGGLRGAELARAFYTDVVEPLLSQAVPGLRYAAARLGSGSDVLGLDDAMSRDHDWGCRLTLLVDEEDRDQVARISRTLDEAVPRALLDGITDPEVARLPPMIGALEQWVDSTDVLSSPGRRAALRAAYRME